jgi:hypothetical protein
MMPTPKRTSKASYPKYNTELGSTMDSIYGEGTFEAIMAEANDKTSALMVPFTDCHNLLNCLEAPPCRPLHIARTREEDETT